MKRVLFSLVTLLALFCMSASAESVIIDKTKAENAGFEFAKDAQLLEVYFPEIYGVDSALLRYGEHTMLIDCAGPQQRKAVQSMLDKLKITNLTYALNSHPDSDHIGGFDRVLRKTPAGEFLLGFPEDHPDGHEVRFSVYQALHDMNIPFRRVHDGESIDFGDVSVKVIQRTNADLPGVNDMSVMLMVQLGDRKAFFTGDIQFATQTLLEGETQPLDLKADILKAPHHGYTGMSSGFLDMVSPELVIFTGGSHTTKGDVQLKERGIPYVHTAYGIIRLATDGSVWTIERVR